jgi:PAP2 superfamily
MLIAPRFIALPSSLFRYGRGRLIRTLGTLYPAFILLVVVATGNHFFLDAAAGALVAMLALAGASLLPRAAATNPAIALPVPDVLPPPKSWRPNDHGRRQRLERRARDT